MKKTKFNEFLFEVFALIVIVETIVNGVFFAQGSQQALSAVPQKRWSCRCSTSHLPFSRPASHCACFFM